MSLKHFHILFIFLAVLSAFGFGAFALLIEDLPSFFPPMGWVSVVGGVALVIYGVRFLQKAKNVIT